MGVELYCGVEELVGVEGDDLALDIVGFADK